MTTRVGPSGSPALEFRLGALLESAIERLPDGTREVFVLRQIEGMSTEEVATALAYRRSVFARLFHQAAAGADIPMK